MCVTVTVCVCILSVIYVCVSVYTFSNLGSKLNPLPVHKYVSEGHQTADTLVEIRDERIITRMV